MTEIIRKLSFKKLILNFIGLTLGAMIYSAGLHLFLVPNNIIDGGVVGISLILSELTKISFSFWVVILNIPFFYLGYKRLGKSLAVFATVAVVILSFWTHWFETWQPITTDPFLATIFGSLLGVSTTTTYVESAAGVGEGGRTGLTAVTVAFLFLVSIFFSPIFLAIPAFATAPALIIVGFLMFTSVATTNFGELTEAIPAYITIIAMPFFYSISEGISMGIISYVVLNALSGEKKKISPLLIILAIVFIAKYFFIG